MAAPDPYALLKMEPLTELRDDDKSSPRKANKPLMEKRRRARINRSLSELKTILVDNLKKSTPGHSKWEKADILEMTVNYVQCLKNQKQANKTDPLAVGQFIAGFSECIRQLKKFGSENEEQAWDENLEGRLTEFLLGYLKNFSDDATRTLGKSHLPPATSPPPSTRLKIVPGGCGEVQNVLGGSPSSQGSYHSPTSGSLSPNPPLSPSHDSSSSLSEASPTKDPPAPPPPPSLLHNPPYLKLSIPQFPTNPSAQLHGFRTYTDYPPHIQQSLPGFQGRVPGAFPDFQRRVGTLPDGQVQGTASIGGNKGPLVVHAGLLPIMHPQPRMQPVVTESLLAQQLQQAPFSRIPSFLSPNSTPAGRGQIPGPEMPRTDLHFLAGQSSPSVWRPW